MLCLFVKWSWVPPKLILYCVSPSKWFVITSNSICKNCNHHFFFPSRSSFFPWFLCLLMASAAFSQSPSLETLSHLLFAPPPISLSAIALTFMFPPFHLHCQHLSVGPFNDYQNKSVNKSDGLKDIMVRIIKIPYCTLNCTSFQTIMWSFSSIYLIFTW